MDTEIVALVETVEHAIAALRAYVTRSGGDPAVLPMITALGESVESLQVALQLRPGAVARPQGPGTPAPPPPTRCAA